MATAAQLDALDQACLAAHQEISNAKATQAAVDAATAGVTSAQSALDGANTANDAEAQKVKDALGAVTAAITAAGF
jgi:hypothetical protein